VAKRHSLFTRTLVITALAGAMVGAGVPSIMPVSNAAAENARPAWMPLGGVFKFLGIGRKRKDKNAAKPKVVRRKIIEIPKDPDARQVLVIGDAFGSGLGNGLREAYAKVPTVAISRKARGSSGFVRIKRLDWSLLAKELIEKSPTDFVVVMIGLNDRRKIRQKGERLVLRSEAWEKIYRQRVKALVDVLQKADKPFYWVGLPPTHSAKLSQDLAYFNTIYKETVEASGGVFIDIWNIFVNEEGKYTSFGPDIDGRKRRLRSSNGISFTGRGNRKLAFFVERELNRAINDGVTELANLDIGAGIDGKQIGVAISLGEPIARANEGLAGGDADVVKPDEDNNHFKLIVRGEAIPAPAGRADDFRWPRVDPPESPPTPIADKVANNPGKTALVKPQN